MVGREVSLTLNLIDMAWFFFMNISKADTYEEHPKMKRDDQLKAFFFPSFSGIRCTLWL